MPSTTTFHSHQPSSIFQTEESKIKPSSSSTTAQPSAPSLTHLQMQKITTCKPRVAPKATQFIFITRCSSRTTINVVNQIQETTKNFFSVAMQTLQNLEAQASLKDKQHIHPPFCTCNKKPQKTQSSASMAESCASLESEASFPISRRRRQIEAFQIRLPPIPNPNFGWK
ncbi:hypothetical protein V8G54_036222, partial [Vigna mungo]